MTTAYKGRDPGAIELIRAMSREQFYYALSQLTIMEREVFNLLTNPMRPRTINDVARICTTKPYQVRQWRDKAIATLLQSLKEEIRW